MMPINAILALINAALPNVANLIVAIKNNSGGVDVGILTNQADATDQTYIQSVQAWLAAHPKAPPPAPPAPPAPPVA